MSSILLTIFDDLEAMTVAYTDKAGASVTANCLNIDEFSGNIQTAHLPCRILMSNNAENGTVMYGAGVNATWNITDLFLLETVARDIGNVINPALQRYKVAYVEALAKTFQFVHGWSTESRTLSYSAQTGKFEYPAQSGVEFFGVKFDITISEIV